LQFGQSENQYYIDIDKYQLIGIVLALGVWLREWGESSSHPSLQPRLHAGNLLFLFGKVDDALLQRSKSLAKMGGWH